MALVLGWFTLTLPDIEQIALGTRRPSVLLVSQEGEVFATYGDVYGGAIGPDELPPLVVQAVLATEDRNFYDHFGVDPWGVARAFYTNLRAGRTVQGGSTITQQLAKNLFLSPERSLERKIQEVLLAFMLEYRFTKNEILAIYLNRVYLGSGTFGIDAAARRYFEVPAGKLNLYQAAAIAGLLKAPSRYSPLNDPMAGHKRTEVALQNMVAAGYITQEQAERAAASGAISMMNRPQSAGRYFADWVMSEVNSLKELQGQDLIVHTTLNLGLQRQVEASLRALLDGDGAKANATQGAVVVMTPQGAVRAMTGGRDYDDSQFNRASQSRRQPGSAFKTFVYTAAMERGYTPWSIFTDEPIKRGKWRPGNYNGKFEGDVNLRHAFSRSTNTVAIEVLEAVGPKAVIAQAQKMGISSPLTSDTSLALGTSEVSLLELTTANVPLANGGQAFFPQGVVAITTPQGKPLWRPQGGGLGQVVSDGALSSMLDLLETVMTEGTGKSARLDRPAGGKTGTTQDYRDAWFVGFTADYVAGVWLGNDDQRQEMKKVTGGGLPAKLWKTVMTEVHRGLPSRNLPRPVAASPSPSWQPWSFPLDGNINPGASSGPDNSNAGSDDSGGGLGDLIDSLFR